MQEHQTTLSFPTPPQAAMVRALKATLEANGSFGDAFAALPGFVAQTLPDGIQVGTHAAHKTGAVIAPTIAALSCADATTQDLAISVIGQSFLDTRGASLKWDIEGDTGQKRASAIYPVSQKVNLQITCIDEAVEPYFDGRQFAGATIILQLVQAPKRALH